MSIHRYCFILRDAYYLVEDHSGIMFGKNVLYIYQGNVKLHIIGCHNPEEDSWTHISKIKDIKEFNGCWLMVSHEDKGHDEYAKKGNYDFLKPKVNKILPLA